MKDELLIVDFGSQYTQLIARRLRQANYYATVIPQAAVNSATLQAFEGKGLILAGSHHSATTNNHPHLRRFVRSERLPVLGICYGMHLLVQFYQGKVRRGNSGEYGATEIRAVASSPLWEGVQTTSHQRVWMSHGDEAHVLPPGFVCTARSKSGSIAAFESPSKRVYAVQFHPEVSQTVGGGRMLSNFARMCGCRAAWTQGNIINKILAAMRARVGAKDRAIIALSGGVDSTVACVLAHRVFGDRMTPMLVDNGLLRANESEQVVSELRDHLNIKVHRIKAARRFRDALKGVQDPEKKRSIIGKTFIQVFEQETQRLDGADWLIQGTIYPDVIESAAVAGAQVIKSHHNVGGLPAKMNLRLLEPIRMLFKDEVRRLGEKLGIARSLLWRHPFPGPGLAVRIAGEVRPQYVKILRAADSIYLDELRQAGYYNKVSQAFCVFLPVRSVGVGGDARSYHYVVVLRAVVTEDFMTAQAASLPAQFLQKVATRIINEVEKVGRVVYDCSSKPPATIEWE